MGTPGYIVQYNHETGTLIRVFQIPSGFTAPSNIVLSPEGKLWLLAWDSAGNGIHVLVLDITTALGGGSGSTARDPHVMGYGMGGPMSLALG